MVPVPLACVLPSRPEPLADWPMLGSRLLAPSRSRSVCLTCHFFRHHPDAGGIPFLACHLHQGLIAHGDHITRSCPGWAPVCRDGRMSVG